VTGPERYPAPTKQRRGHRYSPTSVRRRPFPSIIVTSGLSIFLIALNGYLFAQRNETGYQELPILEVSLNTGVRIREFEGAARKQVMSDRGKYKRAARGDIAYNMMRLWQGAVGVAPRDGLVSPAYVVARPYPNNASAYFVELFRTDAYKTEINKYSRGIVSDRNRLYWDEFKQMLVCVPPPQEQAAIVRYLNHAEQNIRRFIQGKRRLIELLNEQRTRQVDQILSHGVRGLATLSEAEGDGRAMDPCDREVVRLKHVAKIQTGLTLGKNYGNAPLVTRPYLRVANVQNGYLDLSKITHVQVPLAEARGCELQEGDVLMTEGGDIDKLGRGCLWDSQIEGCLHQNHLFAVRPDFSRLLPAFLVLLMQSRHGRCYFERTAKKTTNLASTNSTILKAFPFPLPSVHEQREILEAASFHTAEIHAGISRAQREIDLISEYRTSLIADVVTGKLDVREAAERLPSSAEQEALDDESRDLSAFASQESDGLDDDSELFPLPADEE
jgi:type I restriction enzyme S subunit